MRTLRIDSKTYLVIGDDKDPEETKQRFLDKLRISRER